MDSDWGAVQPKLTVRSSSLREMVAYTSGGLGVGVGVGGTGVDVGGGTGVGVGGTGVGVGGTGVAVGGLGVGVQHSGMSQYLGSEQSGSSSFFFASSSSSSSPLSWPSATPAGGAMSHKTPTNSAKATNTIVIAPPTPSCFAIRYRRPSSILPAVECLISRLLSGIIQDLAQYVGKSQGIIDDIMMIFSENGPIGAILTLAACAMTQGTRHDPKYRSASRESPLIVGEDPG